MNDFNDYGARANWMQPSRGVPGIRDGGGGNRDPWFGGVPPHIGGGGGLGRGQDPRGGGGGGGGGGGNPSFIRPQPRDPGPAGGEYRGGQWFEYPFGGGGGGGAGIRPPMGGGADLIGPPAWQGRGGDGMRSPMNWGRPDMRGGDGMGRWGQGWGQGGRWGDASGLASLRRDPGQFGGWYGEGGRTNWMPR